MTNLKNRRWVLADYPDGMPDESHFRLEDGLDVPEPGDGEILVQAKYLSVDPYMRGRISPAANYAAGVAPGELMQGGGVGEVVVSNSPDFAPGDIVESRDFGWQEFTILGPKSGINKVDPDLAPIQSSLSYLGMPGMTAWAGLFRVGEIKPGETVVISAASGAVGQVAGQLAKAHGCKTVAVASTQAKLEWCSEIGYDVGVNYREADDLSATIAHACPDGVDFYFDNTAGPIHDAVMENLALGARIGICGTISLAGQLDQPDIGPRYHRKILVARAQMQGFLVHDFAADFDEARKHIVGLIDSGAFKFKEDVSDGLDSMAGAFLKLLHSENFGKQLVKVG